jgi:hypothetical protein
VDEENKLRGVQLLWAADYWDGPIAGLARYDGREHWFEVEEFDWDDPPPASERRFRLYALNDEELRDEQEWHRRFQKHVGTHSDYERSGNRGHAAVKPPSEWPKFYDEYERRPPREYASREPIGWFVLGE